LDKELDGMPMVARFIVIGATAAAAYVVLSSLLHVLGLQAWIASLVSYLFILPIAYLAQRNITFESSASHSSSFPKYAATQLVGLALSALVPYQLEQSSGVPATIAFGLAAIVIALVNFILVKYWAFAAHASSN
jgi:putative flippase GtrA